MDKIEMREWWERTWQEREDLIRRIFGDTQPPGMVRAFFWEELRYGVPGGCAMIFPPRLSRLDWLVLTHGMSQPFGPAEVHGSDHPSAYGYEFGILSKKEPVWAPAALRLLITYVKQSGKPILRGHRVPFAFFKDSENTIRPHLGKTALDQQPYGETRALIFWPYMLHPSGFSTSTGYFSILIGTSITEMEWDMAKATSSEHLLVLLFRAGLGQVCDLERRTLTLSSQWKLEWEYICRLSQEEAGTALLEYASKPT
jgi:hypothetical protein